MREIKFRGKRVNNGEWVSGWYCVIKGTHFIIVKQAMCSLLNVDILTIQGIVPVIPETVGQYTGLKDKNGVEIYAGDIVHVGKCPITPVVYWDDDLACFMTSPSHENTGPRQLNAFAWTEHNICEVIGNIYDNSELLGVK